MNESRNTDSDKYILHMGKINRWTRDETSERVRGGDSVTIDRVQGHQYVIGVASSDTDTSAEQTRHE